MENRKVIVSHITSIRMQRFKEQLQGKDTLISHEQLEEKEVCDVDSHDGERIHLLAAPLLSRDQHPESLSVHLQQHKLSEQNKTQTDREKERHLSEIDEILQS